MKETEEEGGWYMTGGKGWCRKRRGEKTTKVREGGRKREARERK